MQEDKKNPLSVPWQTRLLMGAFKKPEVRNTYDLYRKSGSLQDSIPEFRVGEEPEDQDYRIKDGNVWQYTAKEGTFTAIGGVFKKGETPEDGAIRIKGNDILRFNSADGNYDVVKSLPSSFIGKDPHPELSKPGMFKMTATGENRAVPTIDPEYFKEIGRNIPESTVNMAAGLMGPQDPFNISTALQDLSHGQRPSEAMFPHTYEGIDKGKTLSRSVGFAKDAGNIITAPVQLAYRALKHPEQTLRDDPAGFAMGLAVFAGGLKAGRYGIAKALNRDMGTNSLIKSITSIKDSDWPTFLGNKHDVINRVLELQGEGKASVPTSPKDWNAFKKPGSEGFLQKAPPAEGQKLMLKEYARLKKLGDTGSGVDAMRAKELLGLYNKTRGEETARVQSEIGYTKSNDAGVRSIPDIGEPLPPMPENKGIRIPEKTSPVPAYVPPEKTPFIDTLLGKFRFSPVAKEAIAKIMDRTTKVSIGDLQGKHVINEITKGLSKSEINSIPFLIEGTDPIVLESLGMKDIAKNVRTPRMELAVAKSKMGGVFAKDFGFLKEHYDPVNFREHYVSHMWDLTPAQTESFMNMFGTTNPFTKPNRIPTMAEGLQAGYKLKTTSIREIYEIYNRYKHRAVANVELANSLFRMTGEDGQPLISSKKLPGYDELVHPVLGGKKTAYCNPELTPVLKSIWSYTDKAGWAKGLDTINSYVKYSNLALTFFHHGALGESGIGAIGPVKTTGVFIDSFRRWIKGKPAFILDEENLPMVKESMKHKVNYNTPSDAQRSVINKSLESLANKAPRGVSDALKAMNIGFNKYNQFLWDHIHNTLKAMTYEKMVFDQIPRTEKAVFKEKGRPINQAEIDFAKDRIGSFVNDSFGGLNTENINFMGEMLSNPKIQSSLHRILLAPDWTLAVVRQFTGPARGSIQIASSREMAKSGLEHEAGVEFAGGHALQGVSTRYWRNMLAYSFLAIESANYATTKSITGKGHFTWDNEPGNELKIFVGRGGVGKNEEGKPAIYMGYGKQIREPLGWVTKPLSTLGSKTAPWLRTVTKQFTKHDPGTGWETSFADEEGIDWAERAKSAAVDWIPFSLRSVITKQGAGTMAFIWPLNYGMTERKAANYFQKYLSIEDPAIRERKIRNLTTACADSGVNAEDALATAKSLTKSQGVFDRARYERDIIEQVEGLSRIQQAESLNLMLKNEDINSSMYRRVIGELKNGQEVAVMRKNIAEEQDYLSRISKDRYLTAETEAGKIRDSYDGTRNMIIMMMRDNKMSDAIKLMTEWNNSTQDRINSLAEAANVSPGKIMEGGFIGRYLFKQAQIESMAKDAYNTDRSTALERQTDIREWK